MASAAGAWRLLVIATAQLMVVLDATIVNVALPHIQRALGFTASKLEWVITAYALSFGGLLLLGGRPGDILGRRLVFIAGLAVFSTDWFSRISADTSYPGGLLGPTLVTATGLGMLFVALSLTVLNKIRPEDSGLASSLLNTNQQVGRRARPGSARHRGMDQRATTIAIERRGEAPCLSAGQQGWRRAPERSPDPSLPSPRAATVAAGLVTADPWPRPYAPGNAAGTAPKGEPVIARMWRGWTRSWDADAYAEHLRQTTLPQCRKAPGNKAAYLLRRGDGDRTEFAVLTLWQSLDAVRAFAGEDIEQSVPSPEDDAFRTGPPPAITHYQVIEQQ